MSSFRIMFLGDVVGRIGRRLLVSHLASLMQDYSPNMVIANGENASGGAGLDNKSADELFGTGIDVITLGNHVWDRKDIVQRLEIDSGRLIRPANYPSSNPGKGFAIWCSKDDVRVGVLNLMGRVFLSDCVASPFEVADEVILANSGKFDILFVDIHAEASSEKAAMAYHLNGRASIVVGTHTHVQTSDERILSGGTAFLTDVGMTGAVDGIIGFEHGPIVHRFLTGRPGRFEPASGEGQINGLIVDCDRSSGRAINIVRILRKFPASSS